MDKVDGKGDLLASMDFGENASVAAMAVDPNGNLVIVGSTTSLGGFPLVSPLISKTSQDAAFIMKVEPQLQKILFSTLLGGTQGSGPSRGGTSGGALAIDGEGNIYVTGGTLDTDFPVTPGAYQTQPPQGDAFGSPLYAYVAEISGDGQKLVLSTYFGADHVTCFGGSHCIGTHGQTTGTAIALDVDGNVVIAGNTDADKLPVTPGVFGPTCGACTSDLRTSFLAKFGSSGSKLLWATYFPIAAETPEPAVTDLVAMVLDSAGNIIVGGSAPVGFPATAGAVETTAPVNDFFPGFVSKVDSTAHQLLFSTYFGGGAPTGVNGITLDSQGTIWITGTSDPQELPVPKGTPLLGPAYVAGLSPDGSKVTNIFTAPDGAAGQAIARAGGGTIVTLGSRGSLLTVSPGMGPSLVGIANAAATHVSPTVAPYELISLYGLGIGPSIPASGQVVNGEAPTSLSGVQVLFDGVPGGLLYVGPNQINAIVAPNVVTRDRTAVQVMTPSGTIDGPTMAVRPSQPGVFLNPVPPAYGILAAAALNEDGTLNSAANPAAPGSIVSVWGTGGGLMDLPVSVLRSEGEPAYSLEVLYAGPAPGMANGVIQINFRLPSADVAALTLGYELQIGDAVSDLFSIYVRK